METMYRPKSVCVSVALVVVAPIVGHAIACLQGASDSDRLCSAGIAPGSQGSNFCREIASMRKLSESAVIQLRRPYTPTGGPSGGARSHEQASATRQHDRLYVSVAMLGVGAFTALVGLALRDSLTQGGLTCVGALGAALVLGFAVVFCGSLVLSAFTEGEALFDALPPEQILVGYLFLAMVIAFGLKPEVTGNIIIDTVMIALVWEVCSVLTTVGALLLLRKHEQIGPPQLLVFVIAWFAVAFILRVATWAVGGE